MNGRTHMACGAVLPTLALGPMAAALPLVPETSAVLLPAVAAAGAVAGLLPDIDEPGAMLGRGSWMPKAFGPLLRGLAVLVSLPFRVLGYFIKGVLGHRGGTHSLAMSFIFTLAFAIPITTALGGGGDWLVWTIWLGYLSHLLSDSLNPSGVPWLWPLLHKDRRFRLIPKAMTIRTQTPPKFRELVIRYGCWALTFLLLLFYCVAAPLAALLG